MRPRPITTGHTLAVRGHRLVVHHAVAGAQDVLSQGDGVSGHVDAGYDAHTADL